jgi:hypothetical protein
VALEHAEVGQTTVTQNPLNPVLLLVSRLDIVLVYSVPYLKALRKKAKKLHYHRLNYFQSLKELIITTVTRWSLSL